MDFLTGTSQARVLPLLHTPERGENETFAEFKARRAASNKANRDAQRNPNHGLQNSRARYRTDMRASGAMGKRVRASDALMAAWAAKRVTNWKGETDPAGAYTLIGRSLDSETGEYIRRKWLAGISAQRGF
jgi:hypothetical protein